MKHNFKKRKPTRLRPGVGRSRRGAWRGCAEGGIEAPGLDAEAELEQRRKGDAEKVEIAWRVRPDHDDVEMNRATA
jgi:hypothetical protein